MAWKWAFGGNFPPHFVLQVAQLCLQVCESPVIVEAPEWNIMYKKPMKKRTSDLGNVDCRSAPLVTTLAECEIQFAPT